MKIEPTKWYDRKDAVTGQGKYGSVLLTGADARHKRVELKGEGK